MHIYRNQESSVRLDVYPVGTEPEIYELLAKSPEVVQQRRDIRKSTGDRRIVLGVDRLDPVKGLPERIRAFEEFLEQHSSWRKSVSMIQITVPSRTHLPEYIALKHQIDGLIERINSRFFEHDWIPIIHHYRSYTQEELCAFYGEADICLITSLRDGMNLVAKEFIASQTYNNPGILILSKFCGAAEDLKESIIVNPNDIEGTTKAIKYGLEMPFSERQSRSQKLLKRVQTNSSEKWRERFLADLIQSDTNKPCQEL
jgi:trehalose 6-phosphate synthase